MKPNNDDFLSQEEVDYITKKVKPQNMRGTSKKKMKQKVKDTIKMINPFKTKTIQFDSAFDTELTIKAKVNPIKEKAELSIQLDKMLDKDVEIMVKVNGKVTSFESLQGNSEFTCDFSATKRF